ncbi:MULTISPECIES: SufD family Fe-S cluster assembly protein [Pseudomonadota]|jgi:Fe-S cluster assembly protein SufD|uniref:SufD family Fe-S cluster assembly protein n=2 Tax=Pseudomonadota TaxID=1224 RepID=UPI00076A4E7E|nr:MULTISPECIES: SufD family Fe-S cluster assembly protein [Pseudomonadota]MAF61467.1 Fe-S cluster assembly protein SufD [Blastomonas sp.]|tara:strand:- start:8978 stop:9733 length:756 start_codon:yes stop_codon:yes gene_type:complete
MSGNVIPLPTRKDEAWRYADLDALARVWGDVPQGPERIVVPAGETLSRQIVLPVALSGVSITDLDVEIEAGATFALHLLCTDADYGRMSIHVLLHEGAHFEMGGAILGHSDQTLEIVTSVNHAHPHATSNQVVRSVLAGRATGSFLGKVAVARHAQKTDASQSVKAMLLDRTATANAKPELEIYADDVKCAHGATVGELDKQALFYMAARGLPPQVARKLMLQAFIADAFVSLDDDAAREAIETRALEGLA